MSILLDALRKSENNQKPVEPPNIHSNDMPMEEPKSMQSGLLAIMLIVALLVIGWLVWRQYQPDTVVYRPPVDLPAGKQTENVPATPDAQQTQVKKPKEQVASSGAARPRTPVETYQPSAEERAKAEQAEQAKQARAAAATARKNAAASQTKPPPATTISKDDPAAAKTATKETSEKPVARATTNAPVKKPPAKPAAKVEQKDNYQSPEPQPIGYWELPDNVRAGVPVIKFSVLVYAEEPEDRFVLINGERYKQSDELNPGLVAEEIRRDGVIFSYRLYRFFVER